MRHFHWLFPGIAALLLLTEVSPAKASVGTEGASFLDIPVGAGPAAVGGSYAARAADAYATVWNPAGLGRVQGLEAAGQHLEYLEGIHHEFGSLAIPLRPGSVLGAAIQYLGTGDIQATGNSGSDLGSFSSYYAAYSLAFGQAFGDRFSLGVTGKMIEARLSDVHASAFAGDVGGLFQANDKLSLAATLVNLGSPLTFIDQADPLPMAFRAALLFKPSTHWNLSLDGIYRRTGLASAHTGIEWRPLGCLALRAGYRTDTLRELSPLAGFAAGIGLEVLGQELSYAWVPMGELGNTQYLSLLLKFGKAREEERRNLIYYQSIHSHRMASAMPATIRTSPRAETDSAAVSEPDYDQLMQLLGSDETNERQAQAVRPESEGLR